MIKTWLPTESASSSQEITRGHNAKAVSADGLYGDLQQVTVVRYKEVSPSGHSSGEKGVIKGIATEAQVTRRSDERHGAPRPQTSRQSLPMRRRGAKPG